MAVADVIKEGMTPQAAAEKALKRIEEIFAKYPIGAELRGDHGRRSDSSQAVRPPRQCRRGRRRALGAAACKARSSPGPLPSSFPISRVFLAFVAYPVVYGLWMGNDPSLYAELFDDPIYQRTVVNTAALSSASA